MPSLHSRSTGFRNAIVSNIENNRRFESAFSGPREKARQTPSNHFMSNSRTRVDLPANLALQHPIPRFSRSTGILMRILFQTRSSKTAGTSHRLGPESPVNLG
jgi:hypothetical protein